MKKSDLYGFSNINLDMARSHVEEVLGICLEAHESGYYGGEYYLLKRDDSSFVLQRNFTDEGGELAEDNYPDASILLYINTSNARLASEYRKRLANKIENIFLLKSEDY